MRGGGWNAENSLVGDGRRAVARKCRDCDNAVLDKGRHLCGPCTQRAFADKQRAMRARAQQRAAAQELPQALGAALAGLQSAWLRGLGEMAP